MKAIPASLAHIRSRPQSLAAPARNRRSRVPGLHPGRRTETNLLERALADPRAPRRLDEVPGWTRRRLCREELSVDVATTLDHQAADTAIGQITADALHIDVPRCRYEPPNNQVAFAGDR